jgi:hypothetical protein
VLQAGAGDSGKAESQLFESTEAFEVFQTGVGDSGAVNVQLLELSQPLQVLQTGVGDFGMGEVQLSELRQALEALQGCVVEYAPGEVDRNRSVAPQQLNLRNRLFLIWLHNSLRFSFLYPYWSSMVCAHRLVCGSRMVWQRGCSKRASGRGNDGFPQMESRVVQTALDGAHGNPQRVGGLLACQTALRGQNNNVPQAGWERIDQPPEFLAVFGRLQPIRRGQGPHVRQVLQGLPIRAGIMTPPPRIKADPAMSPVFSEQVDCPRCSDTVNPWPESSARVELAAAEVDRQKGGLKGVLGQAGVAQVPAKVAVQRPLVAVDKLLERLPALLPRVFD